MKQSEAPFRVPRGTLSSKSVYMYIYRPVYIWLINLLMWFKAGKHRAAQQRLIVHTWPISVRLDPSAG